MYHVTKHYPHSLGLSVAFRQPGATSHCKYLHGYALAFTFEFEAEELDENNWVIDFGSLKRLKEWLVETFDHKTVVSNDDPMLHTFQELNGTLIDLRVLPAVGMEAFAKLAFGACCHVIMTTGNFPRVRLTKVTVAEHEGNSASYSEPL